MDKIAVLDFGGQYAHLVANRVRRLGVFSEILDPETPANKLREYKGIILSGGPSSVNDPSSPQIDPGVFELGIPILGMCYGHQVTAHNLGGIVEKGQVREYGHATANFKEKKGAFEGIQDSETVWMSHFDQVTKVPAGFEIVASTEDCPIAAMADYKRNIYCLQFHPEVSHTPCGSQIMDNFVNITNAKRDWNIDAYIERILTEIKEKVGDKKVFLMVSGGVDSTVAFMLLDKALGQENVYGLFVDIGFMRMNERKEVEEALKAVGIANLHVYDAGDEYFEALDGVYEPEQKRNIIGDLFLDIQRKVSDDLGLDTENWILGQGTIYPDTIETGESKHADKIKTHHNRVERVQKLMEQGKVIEPLSQLYKDEVRLVGERLGLDKHMVWRHPFPGPGLAVRSLCSEGPVLPNDHDAIERKINEMLAGDGLKAKILPIKSVGVQGDERTYNHPVVLYGSDKSWDDLNRLSTQLTNQFDSINRVLYGLEPSEITSVDAQNSYLTKERVLTIQQADKIVMDFLAESGIQDQIWQFPTVLIPVQVNGSNLESVVLRPVESQEAMTASFYHMAPQHLSELTKRLVSLGTFSGVFYDITNKPPGTIEWE